jgi:hypothetical protein
LEAGAELGGRGLISGYEYYRGVGKGSGGGLTSVNAGRASRSVTAWPARESAMAAPRPARPPPVMRMVRGMAGLGLKG